MYFRHKFPSRLSCQRLMPITADNTISLLSSRKCHPHGDARSPIQRPLIIPSPLSPALIRCSSYLCSLKQSKNQCELYTSHTCGLTGQLKPVTFPSGKMFKFLPSTHEWLSGCTTLFVLIWRSAAAATKSKYHVQKQLFTGSRHCCTTATC